MSWLLTLLGFMVAASATAPHSLVQERWQRLPLGAIRPKGWLLTQMTLQSKALTSHLPLFWPNIANTSWLGGFADVDGGIHENTPYWLNGAVPLAVQVEDEELMKTVEQYFEGIFTRQGSDGWLGPDTDRSDFWSRIPFMLALAQYHESLPEGHQRSRCASVAHRFFTAVGQRLEEGVQLGSWSSMRAHDLIWSIHYFAALLPANSSFAHWLLDLAKRLHEAAFQWNEQWFNSSAFATAPVILDSLKTHGVNNAQAVKHGVVWARQSGEVQQGFAESWLAWSQLQRFHGQPHGAFSADEHLAGTNPSRGTELCAVVEAMWSLLLTAQLAPNDRSAVKPLDALEVLAYNALPGSLSEDLWSHPYLQLANSYQALSHEVDHVWTHDGPDSAMYGLAPNYPCCTSNFHQGYPKFAANLFFESPETKEIISALWAPSLARFSHLGAQIELKTDYPFNAGVEYWIQNEEPFQLTIRLPPFLRDDPSAAASLRVTLEGRTVNRTVVDGFLRVQVTSKAERPRLAVRLDFALEPRVSRSSEGSTVHVGPLLMALDLAEERKEVRRHAFEAADWDTFTRKSWQVALPETPRFGDVRHRSFDLPPLPHDAARCPLALEAELVGVRWPAEHQAPAAPPEALVPGQAARSNRTLLPYACTAIRISAFPQQSTESSRWI
ncbi:unnamed protein product [Durusdinium trenchii]|uniref:Non-reducing end beta-L-arabinofuranosidase-like GH127 middle domain-containing protein n=1 Tax=Durusdinium trenchii TaxID=1381693 RepID=A0ABP0KR43_9DINO